MRCQTLLGWTYLSCRSLDDSAFPFPHRVKVLVPTIFLSIRIHIENLQWVISELA